MKIYKESRSFGKRHTSRYTIRGTTEGETKFRTRVAYAERVGSNFVRMKKERREKNHRGRPKVAASLDRSFILLESAHNRQPPPPPPLPDRYWETAASQCTKEFERLSSVSLSRERERGRERGATKPTKPSGLSATGAK